MTTYNTGNNLGSTDPRDLYDNAENLDNAVNDLTSPTWKDRLGNTRTTLAGQIGYIGTGVDGAIEDYSAGQELSTFSTIIRYNGEFYRPSASASLPYTTTTATPDVDANLVPVGDATLRQDLANPATSGGSDLVAHTGTTESVTEALDKRTIYVGSVAELQSFDTSGIPDGQQISVSAYHGDTEGGGGIFKWDATGDVTAHNGGTIIDPSKQFPANWSDVAEQSTWFTANSTGTGVWRRNTDGAINIRDFGAKGDDATDDYLPLYYSIAVSGHIYIPKGVFVVSGDILISEFSNTHMLVEGGGRASSIVKYTGSGTLFDVDVNFRTAAFNDFEITTNAANGTASTFSQGLFTSVTTQNAGCDNYTARAINFGASTGSHYAEGLYITNFHKAIEFGIGFGGSVRNCELRWNNIAVSFNGAVTTTTVVDSIIERSCLGVYLRSAQQIQLKNTVIEANYGGGDVFFDSWNRNLVIDSCYFEASPFAVKTVGDSGSQYQSDGLYISNCYGLDLKLGNFINNVFTYNNKFSGGIENNYAVNSGPRRVVSSYDTKLVVGEVDVPLDRSDITGNKADEVVLNNLTQEDLENSGLGEYFTTRYNRVIANGGPEPTFNVTVPNGDFHAYIKVSAIKYALTDPKDTRVLYYNIGITRVAGEDAVYEVDAGTNTDSFTYSMAERLSGNTTTHYPPTVFISSGAATEDQVVSLNIASGRGGGTSAVNVVKAEFVCSSEVSITKA